MREIRVNIDTWQILDPTGNSLAAAKVPIRLGYQEQSDWRFTVVDSDGDVVDMSDAVTWAAAADDDFDHTTTPMVRVLDADIDDSGAASGVLVVSVDADTATFATAMGTTTRKNGWFEVKGFDASANRIFYFLFEIDLWNSLDPDGTPSPDPASNYYSKSEADALLSAKADLVGDDDIEITDAAKGLILKAPNGTRYRITITNTGQLKRSGL